MPDDMWQNSMESHHLEEVTMQTVVEIGILHLSRKVVYTFRKYEFGQTYRVAIPFVMLLA